MVSESITLGDTYRNDQYRFQFEIPAGWMPVPEAELQQMAKASDKSSSGHRVIFVAGYRAKRLLPIGAPMVLAQVVTDGVRGATYQAIERDFAKAFAKGAQKAQEKFAGVITDIQ